MKERLNIPSNPGDLSIMNIGIRFFAVSIIAAVAVGTTGCASSRLDVPGVLGSKKDCALSATNRIEDAVADAKSKLDKGCKSSFSSYYTRLLQLGEGYPRPENAQQYQDFLRWSVNKGIVSKVQAGKRYDRYFSTTFSGLNGNRSVASSVCPNLDQTLTSLRGELADKKTGLQGILGQQARYQQATRLYYNLELNLHAACAATEA